MEKYSLQYGVSFEMVSAICYVESHFNPNAVSSRGAVGIMQILPSTGEWIAKCLDIEGYSVDSLFDVELNIRFGVYYLSYLYYKFHVDGWVIAAYNAGEGQVSKWIDAGVTLETIPFPETQNYVRKVMRAIRRYQNKKIISFI